MPSTARATSPAMRPRAAAPPDSKPEMSISGTSETAIAPSFRAED